MLVLQCLNSYAALLAPLPGRHSVLWAAVAELFDNFFLACFILFSGVSLEALVWQEDLLPHRLRSALLRITTSKGCKYRAQVSAALLVTECSGMSNKNSSRAARIVSEAAYSFR